MSLNTNRMLTKAKIFLTLITRQKKHITPNELVYASDRYHCEEKVIHNSFQPRKKNPKKNVIRVMIKDIC